MASRSLATRAVFCLHLLGLPGSRLKRGDRLLVLWQKALSQPAPESAHLDGPGCAFGCRCAGEHAMAEIAHCSQASSRI